MKTEQAIRDYLDELRPAVISDGGDIEFVSFDKADGTLSLRLIGACTNCMIKDVTLTHYLEEQLRQRFSIIQRIVSL